MVGRSFEAFSEAFVYNFRVKNKSLLDELKARDNLLEGVQKQLASMNGLQKLNEELQIKNKHLSQSNETFCVNINELVDEKENLKAWKEGMENTIYVYEERLRQAEQKVVSQEIF